MEEKKEVFSYTYSAEEQQELQRIRQKYIPQQESKLDRLRRLDAQVTRPGAVASLTVGVVSTLVMGMGMSCCMVFGGAWFLPGIAIGLVGMVGIALAYPVYQYITKRQRRKLAPEILRLTEELMK